MIQEEAGSIQQNFWMMDTWNEEEKKQPPVSPYL